jgi:hypothetical protein
MLQDFTKLADAEDRQILSYARHWGVLGLCACGLPHAHNPPSVLFPLVRWDAKKAKYIPWSRGPLPPEHLAELRATAERQTHEQLVSRRLPCPLLQTRGGVLWEPLDRWRELSAAVRAALNIAADLSQGRPGPEEDWRRLDEFEPLGLLMRGPGLMDLTRLTLGGVLNRWMEMGGVAPQILWLPDGARLQLAVSDVRVGQLWGALVLQLLFAASHADGFVFCSACKKPYVTDRQPAAGRDSFCPTCRAGRWPQRLAQRRRRRRLAKGEDAEPLRQKSRKAT